MSPVFASNRAPCPDHEVAAAANPFGGAFLAHPDVTAQRAWLKMSNQPPKVCTGTAIFANMSSTLSGFQPRSPVVRQPVVAEPRAAPDQLLHRVQRQVPLHLVVVDRVQTVDGVSARVLHDARLWRTPNSRS